MKRLIISLFCLALWTSVAQGATTTHLITETNSGNSSIYTTGSFSPVNNDLLVVLIVVSGSVPDGTATVTTTGQSITFTRGGEASFNSANYVGFYVANSFATTTSMTLTFTCTSDPGTGVALFVNGVSGMSRTGASAIRQSDSNVGGVGTTPSSTLPAVALTGNPVLVVVGVNGVNPAALTAPTSWNEQADVGWTTPTFGAEYATRDSGFTGTSITYGATVAGVWGSWGFELDASAAPGGAVHRRAIVIQ